MLLAKYKVLPFYKNLFATKGNTTTSTVHCYCARNYSRSETAQQSHLNAYVGKQIFKMST